MNGENTGKKAKTELIPNWMTVNSLRVNKSDDFYQKRNQENKTYFITRLISLMTFTKRGIRKIKPRAVHYFIVLDKFAFLWLLVAFL